MLGTTYCIGPTLLITYLTYRSSATQMEIQASSFKHLWCLVRS